MEANMKLPGQNLVEKWLTQHVKPKPFKSHSTCLIFQKREKACELSEEKTA
jgi:hypothetical protein